MILECFKDLKFSKDDLKPRKITDLPHFALIKGAKYSGKKSLVFSILDDFAFIDMSDLRYKQEDLNNFIKKEKIRNLVINEPNCELFLDTTNLEHCYILSSNNSYFCKNFIDIKISFLDYEEFIIFSKKNLNENLHLSNYLLLGQNPINIDLEPYKACINLQKILKEELSDNEIITMCKIADRIGNQTSVLSLFKIFLEVKNISKNDFFKCVKSLENKFLLYWVKHVSKDIKKPYFTDFAYKNALTFKKDFLKNYENLIANELLLIYDEIFYHDDIDFVILDANLGIISDPFTNKDFVKLKSKKISKIACDLGIKTILILSLNERFSIFENNVKIIGINLSAWLLSKDMNDWD